MFQLIAGLIPGALKGIWNLGSQWLENKRAVSEVKGQLDVKKFELSSQIELARLQASIEKTQQDGLWENTQAINSGSSWKDELWTIILSFPIITITLAPFIDLLMDPEPYKAGSLLLAVNASLKAFESAPEWYVVLLFVAVGSAFGVRIWERFSSKNGRLVFSGGNDTGNRPQSVPINQDQPPAPVRDAIEQKFDK